MKPADEMSLPEFAEKVATTLVRRYGKTPDEAISMVRAHKGDVVAWYGQEGDECVAASAAGTVVKASAANAPTTRTPSSTILAASAPEKVYGTVAHAIVVAASPFPRVFGLRGYPNDLFRVSLGSSFTGDGRVTLFTQRFDRLSGVWNDFAKGSAAELEAEIEDPPSWFPQRARLDKEAHHAT